MYPRLLLLVMCIWGAHGEGMFKDATSALPSGTLQLNYGVAVTNVGDGTGPMEWVVAGFSGANIVLQMDARTGKYENIAQEGTVYEALRDPGGAAIGVCACDIDGDGLEEIYFLNTNDRYSGPKKVKDRLYKWINGKYEDLFEQSVNDGVSNMFAGRSVACVDRTGSGKYGILLATYAENKAGKFGLIEMNEADSRNDVSMGTVVLHNVAEAAGIDFSTGGRGIAVGPVLGDDGFSDVYFVNEGNYRLGNRGDNALFKNDGAGHFTNVASNMTGSMCRVNNFVDGITKDLNDYEPGRGVALADFNNDGKTDIVYGNWVGPHRLFLQEVDDRGNPKFTNVATPEFSQATPIRTVIAADFDNSGVLQVFMNNIVYSGIDASNKLFKIIPGGDGKVTIRREDIGDALETNQYGTGAAVSDIDGDGVLELVIAHGESRQQSLSFYHVAASKSSGNNWLRILPLTQNGAPARGSKVTVTLDDGTELSRISDGGSGYLCEMEPVTHFGLGRSTPRKLTVTWPDGHSITKTLTPADMNAMHKISFSGELTTVEGSNVGSRPTRNEYNVANQGRSSQDSQSYGAGDGSSRDYYSYRRRNSPKIIYNSNTGDSRTRTTTTATPTRYRPNSGTYRPSSSRQNPESSRTYRPSASTLGQDPESRRTYRPSASSQDSESRRTYRPSSSGQNPESRRQHTDSTRTITYEERRRRPYNSGTASSRKLGQASSTTETHASYSPTNTYDNRQRSHRGRSSSESSSDNRDVASRYNRRRYRPTTTDSTTTSWSYSGNRDVTNRDNRRRYRPTTTTSATTSTSYSGNRDVAYRDNRRRYRPTTTASTTTSWSYSGNRDVAYRENRRRYRPTTTASATSSTTSWSYSGNRDLANRDYRRRYLPRPTTATTTSTNRGRSQNRPTYTDIPRRSSYNTRHYKTAYHAGSRSHGSTAKPENNPSSPRRPEYNPSSRRPEYNPESRGTARRDEGPEYRRSGRGKPSSSDGKTPSYDPYTQVNTRRGQRRNELERVRYSQYYSGSRSSDTSSTGNQNPSSSRSRYQSASSRSRSYYRPSHTSTSQSRSRSQTSEPNTRYSRYYPKSRATESETSPSITAYRYSNPQRSPAASRSTQHHKNYQDNVKSHDTSYGQYDRSRSSSSRQNTKSQPLYDSSSVDRGHGHYSSERRHMSQKA